MPQKTDYIIYDELVHASVWDGMRANERRGVPVSRRRAFRHGDVADLRRILVDILTAENAEQRRTSTATSIPRSSGMIFIAIESLYSMDGDLAPLPQMIQALNELQSLHPTSINPARVCVVVDEAHTTGVYGAQGKGFVYDMVHQERLRGNTGNRMEDWVQVRLMTFGKGMGSQGGKSQNCYCCQIVWLNSRLGYIESDHPAVLLASSTIRSFLINYARPFIFSTAMSVVNVLAIESAFDVVESEKGEEVSLQCRDDLILIETDSNCSLAPTSTDDVSRDFK